jgi:hypothetical protein
MAYKQVIQNASMPVQAQQALIRELDLLRAELDDIRTKYAALLTKLDGDATIVAADWTSTCALPAAKFKAL